MENLSIQQIVVDGLLVSALLSAIIFASLLINPRIWLQDYPAPIREKAAPLNAAEKRMRAAIMLVFLATLVGPLYLSAAGLATRSEGDVSFAAAFVHVFLVFSMFNLVDAVVIDYLVLGLLRPRFALIPEVAGHEHLLLDPRIHVGNFLKGFIFCAVFALPIALLVSG